MSRKLVLAMILTIVLIGLLGVSFGVQRVKASGTIYIRADGSVFPSTANITSVDNVTYTFTDNNYGSIIVERDNIVIDGAGYTLQGTGNGTGIDLSCRTNITNKNMKIKEFEYGIWLNSSSNSNISGNNITANNWYLTFGILLFLSSNNSISGNNITNNYDGILLLDSNYNSISGNNITNNGEDGILFLYHSHYNTVSGNNITANDRNGIGLYSSNYNTISGNNITNNYKGIYLYYCFSNSISGNVMNDNRYNFYVEGYAISHFMHLIDVSNVVDGKPVYYLVNQQYLVINHTTHPQVGYLALINCTNVTVEGLTLTNNGQGLLLANTNNSTIKENNITNNSFGIHLLSSSYNSISGSNITRNYSGIYLWQSSSYNSILGNNITNNNYGIRLWERSNYNTISGNNITNNGYGIDLGSSSNNNSISGNNITANNNYGIWIRSCSNNKIYHNNFVNNTSQVYSYDSVNVWDDGYPSGGNYWSDYAGVDLYSGPYQNVTGSDGIGDIPYVIDENNIDKYPIVYFAGEANFSLQTLYNVSLKANLILYKGTSLVARFYTYSGIYEGDAAVWRGIAPNSTVLSMNITHPLSLPVEIVTLVLTDDGGNIWGLVTTFVVHRSDLINRDMWLDLAWVYEWVPRYIIFLEIIDKDKQWPYAPP